MISPRISRVLVGAASPPRFYRTGRGGDTAPTTPLTVFICLILLVAVRVEAAGLSNDVLRTAFYQSIQAEKTQNYAGAIQSLTALGADANRYYTVQLRLGWLYYSSGKHADAVKHYGAAIKLAPSSIEARLGCLQPLLAQSRYADVETVAKQIWQLDPKNYTANLRLATAYHLMKKDGSANQILSQMSRYYPCDAGVLDERISIPGHQPDPMTQKLRDKFSESSRYEKTQNFTEAIKALESAQWGNYQDYCANLRLSWLYYQTKDYAKSIRCAEVAIQAAPESIEAKLGYVLPLLAQVRYAQAETVVNQVIALDPGNYLAHLRLTSICRLRKDYPKADSEAAAMLVRYPADVTFLTELALARAAQGRTVDAHHLFQQVILLDPENFIARQFLERKPAH